VTRIERHETTEVEYSGGGVRVIVRANGTITIVLASGFGEQSMHATPEQVNSLAEILVTIATGKP